MVDVVRPARARLVGVLPGIRGPRATLLGVGNLACGPVVQSPSLLTTSAEPTEPKSFPLIVALHELCSTTGVVPAETRW